MAKEIMLNVQDVCKRFRLGKSNTDSFKAKISMLFRTNESNRAFFNVLSNVTFSVSQGEVLGIIGSNGAGKSTLLKILSGIFPPDSGVINFYGKPASILEIVAGFHPELTGKENIYLVATLHGLNKPETDKRFAQIVQFSGIEKFIDEPIKNYSAGMYLRLAFSIVVHIDADIFIFDEVLAVGDTAFQIKCRKKFEEIVQKGKAVVMVSHNLAEVAKFADRVIFLKEGKIYETGEATDIIQSYITSTVQKEFLLSGDGSEFVHTIEGNVEGAHFFDALKISVYSSNTGIPGRFYTTDAIAISIEMNKKTKREIIPGLFVSDINDSVALTSTLLNSLEKPSDQNHVGKLIYTLEFPPDFFNTAIIVFSFFFVVLDDTHGYEGAERIAVSKKLTISFEEGMPVMKEIKKMPGIIRPKLKWKVLEP